jgi:hypothetical protein
LKIGAYWKEGQGKASRTVSAVERFNKTALLLSQFISSLWGKCQL